MPVTRDFKAKLKPNGHGRVRSAIITGEGAKTAGDSRVPDLWTLWRSCKIKCGTIESYMIGFV
jgi:hypothetical protein